MNKAGWTELYMLFTCTSNALHAALHCTVSAIAAAAIAAAAINTHARLCCHGYAMAMLWLRLLATRPTPAMGQGRDGVMAARDTHRPVTAAHQ